MWENSRPKIFKNIKLLGEMSKNWQKNLLGTNLYKIFEFCW